MIIDDVIETTLTIVLTRAHSWITHIRAPPPSRASGAERAPAV